MNDLEILPGCPERGTIIERERPGGMLAGVKPQLYNAALLLWFRDEEGCWRDSW